MGSREAEMGGKIAGFGTNRLLEAAKCAQLVVAIGALQHKVARRKITTGREGLRCQHHCCDASLSQVSACTQSAAMRTSSCQVQREVHWENFC